MAALRVTYRRRLSKTVNLHQCTATCQFLCMKLKTMMQKETSTITLVNSLLNSSETSRVILAGITCWSSHWHHKKIERKLTDEKQCQKLHEMVCNYKLFHLQFWRKKDIPCRLYLINSPSGLSGWSINPTYFVKSVSPNLEFWGLITISWNLISNLS